MTGVSGRSAPTLGDEALAESSSRASSEHEESRRKRWDDSRLILLRSLASSPAQSSATIFATPSDLESPGPPALGARVSFYKFGCKCTCPDGCGTTNIRSQAVHRRTPANALRHDGDMLIMGTSLVCSATMATCESRGHR